MNQIKSKDRVRDLAEVYTNEHEVKAMLDLIPLKNSDNILTYRYLEPACGNGNFLIEILRRKLNRVNEKYRASSLGTYELQIAKTVSLIHGIDICEENVMEARARLYGEVKSTVDLHRGSFEYTQGFLPFIHLVLERNIVLGDAINEASKVLFTDFKFNRRNVEQLIYRFDHLSLAKPTPLSVIGSSNYLQIGLEHQADTGCLNEGIQRHLEFV